MKSVNNYFNFFPKIRNIIGENPYYFFSEHMTRKERAILNAIIKNSLRHEDNFISQSTIAEQVKCTREYVNKVIHRFTVYGFVIKDYRHMQTCRYKLSREFFAHGMTKLLSPLLPALKLIPLQLFTLLSVYSFNITYTTNYTLRSNVEFARAREDINQAPSQRIRPRSQTWDSKNFFNTKMGTPMLFTQQQMDTLSKFSPETLDYALEKMLASQKKIESPYRWFLAVCGDKEARNTVVSDNDYYVANSLSPFHREKSRFNSTQKYFNTNQPSTGRTLSSPFKRPSVGPLAIYKEQEPYRAKETSILDTQPLTGPMSSFLAEIQQKKAPEQFQMLSEIHRKAQGYGVYQDGMTYREMQQAIDACDILMRDTKEKPALNGIML